MSQSSEIPDIDEIPTVDYTDLPPEVGAIVGDQPYTVEETVKLTWDGNQFLARIPTEIAAELQLSRESRLQFTFRKPLPNSTDKATVEIDLYPE